MLSSAEKDKVFLKIYELQKDWYRLKKKYKETRDMNRAAWSMYGSELCAGEMEAEERLILKNIGELDNKIKLLKDLFYGRVDINDEENIRQKMADIDQKKQQLDDDKAKLMQSLESISFLRSILK